LKQFKAIKKVKASDEIFQQIKDAIISGRYKAGDKLPSENELSQIFNVSRTTIREAIRSLSTSGLIYIKQGTAGGAFVAELTFDILFNFWQDLYDSGKLTLAEICDARLIIEPQVARIAAKNVNSSFKQKLLKALEDESNAYHQPIYQDGVKLIQGVHLVIAEMSCNIFLESIIKTLAILVRNAHNFLPPMSQAHPAGMHNKLVNAILSGDQDKAEMEMRNHIVDFRNRIKTAEAGHKKH